MLDNFTYEDSALGAFTVKDGAPVWGDHSREDLEAVLVETAAWDQEEAREYDLDRLRAVVWRLMEDRHREEASAIELRDAIATAKGEE